MKKRVLLKDGIIVDGTGSERYTGSVLLENDRIKDVINLVPEDFNGEAINCAHKIIAPGFIDGHSHHDWFIDRDDPLPYFIPFIEQGITSAVAGNCGFSAAGYLHDVQAKCAAGYTIDGRDFSDFAVWLDAMDKTMPINLTSLQGHGTLRFSLVGNSPKRLKPAQLQSMLFMAQDALTKGACGISLGLQYAPGIFSPKEELVEIAKIAKQNDRVLTVHLRALGVVSSVYPIIPGGRAHNLLALDEVIELAKSTGCKLQISHTTFIGKGSFFSNEEMIATIERAHDDGVDIAFDVFSMDCGMSFITLIMPEWYHALPWKEKRSTENIKRFRDEFYEQAKITKFGLDSIYIANDMVKNSKGKSVSQVAEMWDMDPFDTYLKLVDETAGQCRVLMNGFMNDELLEQQTKSQLILYIADAWYEPGSIQNYNLHASFAHFLELSRDGRGPSLEGAVRKMTGASADRFLIANRGYLKKGMYADVCVFDLKAVKSYHDRKPEGFEHVFVNGRHILKDGEVNLSVLPNSGASIKIGK